MKRIIVETFFQTALFIFTNALCFCLRAQDDSNQFVWKNYINELSQKLNLAPISESIFTNEYRFWLDDKMIQIAYDTNNIAFGGIYFWAQEIREDNKKELFFSQSNQLSIHQANKIHQLIDSMQIQVIPTCDSISNWSSGQDGVTIIFQQKIKSKYSFKKYWNPHTHNHLIEAIVISNFISKIQSISESNKKALEFATLNPFMVYTSNQFEHTLRATHSKKEIRELKKKRRQLKKSLKRMKRKQV